MKYKIISMAMICLMLMNSIQVKAQKYPTNNKKILEHLDSLKKDFKSIPNRNSGQTIEEGFDIFYKRADSLNLAQPTLKLSDSIAKIINKYNNELPYYYLSKAEVMYENTPSKLDEIAVLMYIGLMRYDYYLGVNPSYAPNGEGWVTTQSFKQNYKDRIELYLKTNIEKYKEVLKFAIYYCNNNNYTFCKKPKENLMHKKVMQPYESLLNDLNKNQETLVKQWANAKAIKLNPENLKQASELKTTKNQQQKELFSKLNDLFKTGSLKEDLWLKIQEERKNGNTTKLKEYITQFNALNKKGTAIGEGLINPKSTKLQQELATLIQANDTNKIFFRKAFQPETLNSNSSKNEMYNYYDVSNKVSTYNLRITKMNKAILEYLNTYNWDDEKKLNVFNLVKYAPEYFNDGYDKTKDLYLSPIEIKQREINEMKWLQERRDMSNKNEKLLQILGEVEGTLVWEDVYIIRNKYLVDSIETLK